MFWLVVFALLPILTHEGGHFIAALFCGRRLRFRFSWGHLGKIPIPRWIWQWPQNITEKQLRCICQAGFVVELGLIPFAPWTYQVVAVAHFVAYPWYAKDSSDLEGMV